MVNYSLDPKEAPSRIFRRSLFVVQDMQPGDVFAVENVRSIRPGYGLHTRYLQDILQRKAARFIARGTPLSWDLVD
jgi:sialic acid synthase SpsE